MKLLGNVRYQIALILLLAIVPLAALAVYMAIDDGRNNASRAQADSKATVRDVARELDRLIQASSDLVRGFSQSLQNSPQACNAQLASLKPAVPQFANLVVVDTGGNVLCAAANPQHVRTLQHRPQAMALIQRVLHSRRVEVGSFVLTAVGKRVVPVMGPVLDGQGAVRSLFFVTIDLERLDQLVNSVPLPEQAVLLVMDGQGREIARNPRSPDWPAGTPAPPLERTLPGKGDFDREVTGYDGIHRFYSVAAVRPGADLLVVMKMRVSEIYRPARRRLLVHLSGLAIVGMLVLGLTWASSDRYFRRPLSKLIGAANRLASGDLTARTGLAYAGEIGQLAQSFDQMAHTLERDQARENEAAEREARRLQRLKKLSEISMMLAGDPATVFESIVRMLGELFEVRGVCLSEVDGRDLGCRAVYSRGRVISNAGRCPVDITPCATVVAARSIRIYERVLELFPAATFLRDHDAWSWCGFPSLDNDGNVVAVTCLVDDKPHDYSEEDQQILCVIGQRIATEFDRVRSMADHARMERTLRENEHRLQEAQQMAHLGSYSADARSGLMTWSEEMYRIFEIDPAVTDPGSHIVLERTHPDDREQVRGNHARLQRENGPYELEHRLQMPDGRIKYVLVRGNVSPDASGRPHMHGTVQDVTERRRAEEEKARLQAELNQARKMESIGLLAGGIAHDFNNLLTVINGYSRLLLHPSGTPPHKYAEQINKAGESAASLTRQLLAFSRMEVAQAQTVPLNEIVLESSDMLGRLAGDDIEMTTKLDASPDEVLADSGQMQQCLMNLVVNARDAMPAGGQLTIETANVWITRHDLPAGADARPGPHVRLAVRDTGIGMDDETSQRIFEPFFTTKEKGRGTGLGLSTVYGIVSQWQGFIKVLSQPGKGSEFSIYLPLNNTASQQRNHATAENGESHAEGGTVLVVEDDDIVREFVIESLRMSGCDVLEARHGKEALQVIEQKSSAIQLMITDVVMPGMNGKELAAGARALCPSMNVLFMTGYSDGLVLRSNGPDSREQVILKPFAPEALQARVRDLLKVRTSA